MMGTGYNFNRSNQLILVQLDNCVPKLPSANCKPLQAPLTALGPDDVNFNLSFAHQFHLV
jgi:hypothetical protein